VIAHVALEIGVQDADACLRFWWLLGFEQVAPPDALAGRAVWVQAGGEGGVGPIQIHLLFADDPVIPAAGHVAVVAGDYDATLQRLRAAGLAPRSRTEYWGSPRAFVRSPAGHRVEVMAFAPAQAG